MSILTAALVDTAQAERDQRKESYGRRLVGADPETAERMAIDYQCWVAIAEYFDTGHFYSFAGGADPDRSDAPIVSWPALEGAAEAALTNANAKCEKLDSDAKASQDDRTQAHKRRGILFALHARIQHKRALIDSINRELRTGPLEHAA